MIVHGEKPWDGGFRLGAPGPLYCLFHEEEVVWVEEEPLWDGTPRWRMVVRRRLNLWDTAPTVSVSAGCVHWLDDDPRVKS